jgi:hypothetical protein
MYVRRPKFYQSRTVTVIPSKAAQAAARVLDVAKLLSDRFTIYGGPEQSLALLVVMSTGKIKRLDMTLPAFEDACLVLSESLQSTSPLWARAFEALTDLSESEIGHENQDAVSALNQAAYLFLDLSSLPGADPIWAECHKILSMKIQEETATKITIKRAA